MKSDLYYLEYFQSAFSNVLAGIIEIIKIKLKYLRDAKWTFEGWVIGNNYSNIIFALRYSDKETQEDYKVYGKCSIKKTLVINNATFAFDVVDERSRKPIGFNISIDNKNELAEIEDAINHLLENNRSYRYFCEDYERYMKQNPFQYISSLLSNHLIDIKEEVFDNEFGSVYCYSGEFGEDLLEIVINDVCRSNEDITDYIKVDVSKRFHWQFREHYSQNIRSLLPDLKQFIIGVNDFLIRINAQYCLNKEHHLLRIKALVCIDNGKFIDEVGIEALFCKECNQYFIPEFEYEKLCKLGRICSRVITLTEYKSFTESKCAWAKQSLLGSYGYTVNAQKGLSDVERHRILSFVIENQIMTADEVISFIEWLIKRNNKKTFYSARQKWSKDREYIQNYKPIAGSVRVKDIYRKRYVNLKTY